MTRKDYELIAAALKYSKPVATDHFTAQAYHSRNMQHEECCIAVADALARDNEQFNRVRFLAACGTRI